jgi:hypothetical protein
MHASSKGIGSQISLVSSLVENVFQNAEAYKMRRDCSTWRLFNKMFTHKWQKALELLVQMQQEGRE